MNLFTHLESASRTDVGRRRQRNEDAVLTLPEHGVFCVADGMGGLEAGAAASFALVEAVRKVFLDLPDAGQVRSASGKSRLTQRAVSQVNGWINEQTRQRGLSGMGTTVVLLMFHADQPNQALVQHAGDSPAFCFRDRTLARLTRDHTYGSEVGRHNHVRLHAAIDGLITRAVGVEAEVELEETLLRVFPGDIYMLCSDGLTKMVKHDDLTQVFIDHAGGELGTIAQALIDKANNAGGKDNTTVALVRVGDAPQEVPDDDVAEDDAVSPPNPPPTRATRMQP